MSNSVNLTNYISEGSFGKIYSFQTNKVLKLKEIEDTSGACSVWKHEFDIHQYLYNYFLNSGLRHVRIVKPIKFSFSRKHGDKLYPVLENEDYTSCYYTMERVHGVKSVNNNLKQLVDRIDKVTKSVIPPYLYLGAIGGAKGHITLDMLKDVQLHEFFVEGLAYCEVNPNSLAMDLMTEMVAAFFNCILADCMPRDIEYVFNSSGPLCSILDFNQVNTLSERRGNRANYNFEEDIAQVYIDLCGLRKNGTRNPWYADEPTPQWRFLCSPLTAPTAFFTIWQRVAEKIPINISGIMNSILDYTENQYFKSGRKWPSLVPFFYPDSNFSFDMRYQEHIVNTLLASGLDIHSIRGKSFPDTIKILEEQHIKRRYIVEENNWPF